MFSAVERGSLSVRGAEPGTSLYRDALYCVGHRFGGALESKVDELVRTRQASLTALTESEDVERSLAVLAQRTTVSTDSKSSEILALVNRHPSRWGGRGYGSRLLAMAERVAHSASADTLQVRDEAAMESADRAWLRRHGFRKSESQTLWTKRVATSEVSTPPSQKREETPVVRKRAAEAERDRDGEAPVFKLQRRDPQDVPAPRTMQAAGVAASHVAQLPVVPARPQHVPYRARRGGEGVQVDQDRSLQGDAGFRSRGAREPLRMSLKEPYLSMISRGQKTWEGRLYRGAFARCRVGEEMVFFNHTGEVRVRIEEIRYNRSFEGMVQEVGFQNLVPNVATEGDAVRVYRSIYGEQDLGCGCVALRVVVLPATA